MLNKHATPRTIYLKDYSPSAYLIDSVALRFELGAEETRVINHMQIRRNPAVEADEDLVLDGELLELVSLKKDGQVFPVDACTVSDTELRISDPGARFSLEIETLIHPASNFALEGLYLSSGNFCTQCEAQGFRKITYFLDRPDVMTLFTTTLVANKSQYPVLLSNGNPVASGDLDDGRHWVRWEDPYRKPSYLFALVAGDLAVKEDRFLTRSGREVILRIYVEAHNSDKCDHAMRSLMRAMQWDEEVFGLEYDLDIYMIVAVDDFNMGAMENKGLNVFNSKFVLASRETATDDDFVGIEAVIAHEYFHNWTGNRITCRDWFQLSLKEGLTVFRDQEFTADMTSRGVKRIQDVRLLRTHQFAEDASPMAHPVRPKSYIEINNFYTVTIYQKGAEVVRMYHTLLGAEGFRKGMDLYFERHDGQAVTTDDFCAAMADANDVDLTLFRRWYDQAGTPLLTVRDEWEEATGCYRLTLSQSCPETPQQSEKLPFMIPVRIGLLDAEGRSLPLQLVDESEPLGTERVLVMTEDEQVYEFQGLDRRPLPSLLRGYSAPVKLDYAYTREQRAFLMAHDADAFNRWDACQALALDIILELIGRWQTAGELVLDPGLVQAYARVLDDARDDPAFISEVLTLPGEAYIAEQMDVVDVDAIHAVRVFIQGQLAQQLKVQFLALWDELMAQDKDYTLDAQAMGGRRLKSLCLSYLVYLEQDEQVARAMRQFDTASNMTDSMGALSALNHSEHKARETCLKAFHDRWHEDSLVMDKWFSLQAVSQRDDTLERVQELMQHPLFSMKNPNKVRALVGAFAQANPTGFHRKDGAGYRFLSDRVIELDAMNPQVAARMVKPLGRWRRYDPERQTMMQVSLQRIMGHEGLSQDVYEIVAKSLE